MICDWCLVIGDMVVKTYRDLNVWKASMEVVDMIYDVTKSFPHEELYGLTNQMRRSAVSIPSNIAEGFLRKTTRDYLRFVTMAFSSGGELETQLEIARRRQFISQSDFEQISGKQPGL